MSKYMLVSPHVTIRWTETVQEEIIQAVHKVAGKDFTLNKKTLNLLQLCDGTRTCQELVAEFKKSYPQTSPETILKAVKTLSEKGLVVERESVSQSASRISHVRLESPHY